MNTIAEIYLMDCVELLRRQAASSVHMIFTDPAYAALEKHRSLPSGKRRGTTTRLTEASGNDWFPIFPDDRYEEFFAEAYRCLVTRSHMYVMCAADDDQVDIMKAAALAAGFRYWKRVIWDKMRPGMGYHWNAQHEYVLFLEKGNRPWLGNGTWRGKHGWAGRQLNVNGRPDVLSIESIRTKGAYPTEKPVELVNEFVLNSSLRGELVVDPFLGSGSTLESVVECGRRFRGCDVEVKSIRHALNRMPERGDAGRDLRGGRWVVDLPAGQPVQHTLLKI